MVADMPQYFSMFAASLREFKANNLGQTDKNSMRGEHISGSGTSYPPPPPVGIFRVNHVTFMPALANKV